MQGQQNIKFSSLTDPTVSNNSVHRDPPSSSKTQGQFDRQSLHCAFMLVVCTLVKMWVQTDISDLPQLSVSSNIHLGMQALLWLAALSVMLQSTYRAATVRNYKSWGRRPAESLSVLDSQPPLLPLPDDLPNSSSALFYLITWGEFLFYVLQVCYRQNQVCHTQRNIPQFMETHPATQLKLNWDAPPLPSYAFIKCTGTTLSLKVASPCIIIQFK